MPLRNLEYCGKRKRAGDSNFSNSEESMSGKPMSGSSGPLSPSAPRGNRRRSPDPLGTSPYPDNRQHLAQHCHSENPPTLAQQVDDSDVFIENYSEQDAPPPLECYPPSSDAATENDVEARLVEEDEPASPPLLRNHYSDRKMPPRTLEFLGNRKKGSESVLSEKSMSGKRIPGSTGFPATSSPRGNRRRSRDPLGTAPPIAIDNSGKYLGNRKRDSDSMLEKFSNSEKSKSGKRMPRSIAPLSSSAPRGNRRRFRDPLDAPQILERYPPATPSSDAAKENDAEARLEAKRARNRISQKACADKKKKDCQKAREEIPRLREESERLEEANRYRMNSLNDWQKREINVNSKRHEELLARAELLVKELEAELPTIVPREKMLGTCPNTYNHLVFEARQELVLEQHKLEKLRLEKQQAISKKIEELIC